MTQRSLGKLVAGTGLDRSGITADLVKLRADLASESLGVSVKLGMADAAGQLKGIRQEIADLGGVSQRALGQQASAARTVRAEYDALSASLRAEAQQLKTSAAQEQTYRREGAQQAANYRSTLQLNIRLEREAAQQRIASLRSEQAMAREATQTANNYRIAWQRKANDDATTAGIMQTLERRILAQKAALDAEATSLRELGVLDTQQTARLQQLVAMQNTYSQALRTTASVQMQISGEIMKGSLAAGVSAGYRDAAAGVTLLNNQLKSNQITQGEYDLRIRGTITSLQGEVAATQAAITTLREKGVLNAAEAAQLTRLEAAERSYTASLAAATTAQQRNNAARAGAFAQGAGIRGGAGMNGAALGLSFISPTAGMVASLATMGPQVAAIGAAGLVIAGAVKSIDDGVKKSIDFQRSLNQVGALTHESAAEMNQYGQFVQRLSGQLPIATNQLIEMGRQGVLVGLHGPDAIKNFTTQSAALAVVLRDANGHLGDTSKVSQEIAKILFSQGLSVDQVNKKYGETVNVLVALKTQFGAQIPEITGLAKFWSSYAHEIGLTNEQILGISAALVQAGARAQGAGGALTKIFQTAHQAAAQGGPALEAWGRAMGMSGEEVAKLLETDPVAFFTRFIQRLKDFHASGVDSSLILSDLHLRTAQVTRTVSEATVGQNNLKRATDIATAATKDEGLAMRTAKEATKGYGDQVAELGHKWDAFKTNLGTLVLPELNKFLQDANGLLDRILTNLGKGMPQKGVPDAITQLNTGQLRAALGQAGLIKDVSNQGPGGLYSIGALIKEGDGYVRRNQAQLNTIAANRTYYEQLLAKYQRQGGAGPDGVQHVTMQALPSGPAGAQTAQAAGEAAGQWNATFVASLKDRFKNDPKWPSDCAAIASDIYHTLGVAIKGSPSAGELINQVKAHGKQVSEAQAQTGDLVGFTGARYGYNGSGHHVAVVVGRDAKGNLLIIENPGQSNTQVVPMYDTAHAAFYRPNESPYNKAGAPTGTVSKADVAAYIGGKGQVNYSTLNDQARELVLALRSYAQGSPEYTKALAAIHDFTKGNADAAAAVRSVTLELGKVSRYGQTYDKLSAQLGVADSLKKAGRESGADYVRTLEGIAASAQRAADAERARNGETAKYQALQKLAGDATAKATAEQDRLTRAQQQATRLAEQAQQQGEEIIRRQQQSEADAAQTRVSVLTDARQEALDAAQDDAQQQLAIQREFAPKIKAAVIAQAKEQLDEKVAAANKWVSEQEAQARHEGLTATALKDRLSAIEQQGQRERTAAQQEYQRAVTRAGQVSAASVHDATVKVQQETSKQAAAVRDLSRSYKDAQEGLGQKAQAGTLTDADVTAYLASLGKLWDEAGQKGVKGNFQIDQLHKSSVRLAQDLRAELPGILAATQALNDYMDAQAKRFGTGEVASQGALRLTYGAGPEGLAAAVRASGGNLDASTDPTAALADLERFNKGAADLIRTTYADVIQGILDGTQGGLDQAQALMDDFFSRSSARYAGTAATDAAYRMSYGTGDAGLQAAFQAAGGTGDVLTDPQDALSALEQFNGDAVAIIRRVYAEPIQQILDTTEGAVAQAQQDLDDFAASSAARYGNGQNAADMAVRRSYGTGADGLTAALAGAGSDPNDPRFMGDPRKALADLASRNKDFADELQRVYADALKLYRDLPDSTLEKTFNSGQVAQQVKNFQGMTAELEANGDQLKLSAAAADEYRERVQQMGQDGELSAQQVSDLNLILDSLRANLDASPTNALEDTLTQITGDLQKAQDAYQGGTMSALDFGRAGQASALQLDTLADNLERMGKTDAAASVRALAAAARASVPDVAKITDAMREAQRAVEDARLSAERSTLQHQQNMDPLAWLHAGGYQARGEDLDRREANAAYQRQLEDLKRHLEEEGGDRAEYDAKVRAAEADHQAKLTAITEKGEEDRRQIVLNGIEQVGQFAQAIINVGSLVGQATAGMDQHAADVAAGWGESLGDMTSDLITFAKDIATGNWIQAAIDVITSIFTHWAQEAQRAREEMKKTQDYNNQFRFGKDDGYGTRTVTTYQTGILWWSQTHYDEHIDEAAQKTAQSLEGAIVDGVNSGFEALANGGSIEDFSKAIRSSLAKAVKQGMVDAFLDDPAHGKVYKDAIQGYLDAKKALADAKTPEEKAAAQTRLDQSRTNLINVSNANTADAQKTASDMDEIDRLTGTGKYDPAVIAQQARDDAQKAADVWQKTWDNVRAAGLITEEAYQDDVLRLTIEGLNRQREAALADTSLTEAQRATINADYDAQIVAAQIQSAQAIRDARLKDLDDELKGGQISYAQYLQQRQQAELTALDAGYQAAIAQANLTAEQRLAIDQQYAEQRDKILHQTSDDLLNTFSNSAFNGLESALESQDFSKFGANLQQEVLKSTLSGLLMAMESDIVRKALGPLTQAIATDLQNGVDLTSGQGLADLLALKNGVITVKDQTKPLFDAFAPIFAQFGFKADVVQKNTDAIKENTEVQRDKPLSSTTYISNVTPGTRYAGTDAWLGGL